jgi:hypothetical protein
VKLLGLALAVGTLALAGSSALPPKLAGCPVFPANNPWNQPVNKLPVAANSTAIVDSIGADTGLHPDFGSGLWDGAPIGIPITVVKAGVPKVRPSFDYADESDKGPYPIPTAVKVEGGGDRHALIVDSSTCTLYELYALQRTGSGWHAGSGAIWSLRSNKMRPAGWTSADAAGLPILPGLVRWSDVASGRIDHALRFTVERTRRAYLYPARHFASDLTDPNLPPMGLRLRLRADYPIAGFPRQARIVLQALKTYGMIVADNGSSWYISGEPNSHWSNDDLHTLGRVPGSAFQVVDTSTLRPKS